MALAALIALASPSATGTLAPAPLDVAAIEAAAADVRTDPDLGHVAKERRLRLKRSNEPDSAASTAPWLVELAGWFAEGGRILVWLLGAAALAVVIVTARRWIAVCGEGLKPAQTRLPSHVRDLDIRPASLPADVGAAVRELWLAGDRRAALSLLYRGALSRLVHSHGVELGDASTEGDCVRLARAGLAAPRSDFVTALVQAWQIGVYGARPLSTERVLDLCDDFDRMLPVTASPAR